MTKEIWVTSTAEVAITVAAAVSAVNSRQDTWRLFVKSLPETLASDETEVDAKRAAVQVARWAQDPHVSVRIAPGFPRQRPAEVSGRRAWRTRSTSEVAQVGWDGSFRQSTRRGA